MARSKPQRQPVPPLLPDFRGFGGAVTGYDQHDNGISLQNLEAFIHSLTGNLDTEIDADQKDWAAVVTLVEQNLIAWKAHFCDVWPDTVPAHRRTNKS